MSGAPLVSVLMAAHDSASWVGEAIESVLDQTLGDLELIVVDDGSTDATPDVLSGFRDGRLRVERQSRQGLTRSLVRALALARAPVVARLDADDVALPERLARQHAFLERRPEVGLLGTAALEVNVMGLVVSVVTPPTEDAAIRRMLVRKNPFVHSSVMMRRDALEQAGGYDERWPVAQDYDLWMRMSRITRMANLSDVFVVRRLLPTRVGARRDDERLRAEIALRWRAVRGGDYPWWSVVFVVHPALALALPLPLRRALRRAIRAAPGSWSA